MLREVALVGEAYRYGDFMEGKLCIGQQFLRALYPLADDVLVWREARRALESSREVVRAHMCYPSELVEGKVVDQIVSYVVHYASERALREGAFALSLNLPNFPSAQRGVLPKEVYHQHVR